MDWKISASLVAYLYALFVGASYLWGFWLPFGFNVLAHADLTDVLKATVYPLLPAAGLTVALTAWDGLNAITKKEHAENLASGGSLRFLSQLLHWYGWALLVLMLGFMAYQVLTEEGYDKLKGVYPLGSMLLLLLLVNNRHLLGVDVRVRTFGLALLCFLPTAAFNLGNASGKAARDGTGEVWLVKAKETCPTVGGNLVLLARLGGKYLTMSLADKSICILADQNVQLIRRAP